MQALLSSPVTLILIIANVAASFYGFQNRAFLEKNTFWIGPIRQENEWYRFVTSAFMHVNPTHLLMNMITLFFFGPLLEARLGIPGYIFLYFASLVAGNAWELMDNWRNMGYRAVGASGAVSGVILSFCLFAPFELLYVLFAIPMWSIIFGVAFIGISFVLSQKEGTMIAHGAHLGGALAGIVATLIIEPGVAGDFAAQVSQKFGGL